MKISHELTANALVFFLDGELDHHAARDCILYINQQIALNRSVKAELDLSGLTFMDSSGLAVAINAKRAADRTGHPLTIRNAPAQAMKIFKAAHLEQMISFV